jgi:hypothetical protein
MTRPLLRPSRVFLPPSIVDNRPTWSNKMPAPAAVFTSHEHAKDHAWKTMNENDRMMIRVRRAVAAIEAAEKRAREGILDEEPHFVRAFATSGEIHLYDPKGRPIAVMDQETYDAFAAEIVGVKATRHTGIAQTGTTFEQDQRIKQLESVPSPIEDLQRVIMSTWSEPSDAGARILDERWPMRPKDLPFVITDDGIVHYQSASSVAFCGLETFEALRGSPVTDEELASFGLARGKERDE